MRIGAYFCNYLNLYLKNYYINAIPRCCKGTHIIGHGKYRSRQRYKCKECGKTFNDTSCSPMAGTHYPDKWGKYIKFVSMGMTLPKIVKE